MMQIKLTPYRYLRRAMPLFSYAISRGASALLTLTLFSLFSQTLPKVDLANVLSFTLLFGFLANLSRTAPHFMLQRSGQSRRSSQVLQVLQGYRAVIKLVILLMPLTFLITYGLSENILVSLAAALTVSVVSLDSDLLRAPLNKGLSFPWVFLSGTVIALALYLLVLPHTAIYAFWATLAQWGIVGLWNLRAWKFALSKRAKARRIRSEAATIAGPAVFAILAASFDGFIINLPFLPTAAIAQQERSIVAITIRTLISSFVFLPYLLFSYNRRQSDGSPNAGQNRQAVNFFCALFSSSMLLSLPLSLYIFYLGEIEMTLAHVVGIFTLSGSFSFYYSAVRVGRPDGESSMALIMFLGGTALAALVLTTYTPLNAIGVFTLQSGCFSLAGIFALGIKVPKWNRV